MDLSFVSTRAVQAVSNMLYLVVLIALFQAVFGLNITLGPQTAGGNYDIYVNNVKYFPAGTSPVSFHHDGVVYSALPESGNHNFLKATQRDVITQGVDSKGFFTRHTTEWLTLNSIPFTTSATIYENSIVFTQAFPKGATKTNIGDTDAIITSFPNVEVNKYDGGRRGYLQYQGQMTGNTFHIGEWDNLSDGISSTLMDTAPLIVYSLEDQNIAAVLSAFENSMAINQHYDQTAHTLSYGLMGNVTEIPANYELSSIISFTEGGANAAMKGWGDFLLASGGKHRHAAWEKDFTLKYLGYSTDNGCYYWYNTDEGKNYEDSILGLYNYSVEKKIPYQYWLADSWWYFKGASNGVQNWTAMPSVFPNKMEGIYESTQWLVQGHNRFWDATTNYAKQNGGNYEFLVDERPQIPGDKKRYALPIEQDFWNDLMRDAHIWGLTTYEQDWLDTELVNFPPLTQSATLGTLWLKQMAAGADKVGISIQYCMSFARHLLASIELPAVTTTRASEDYHPGNDQWEPLGTTAMFAYAIGLAPSKDSYWTTPVQPGNHWSDDTTETRNRLESAVLTLTKGPVAIGDGNGFSDRALIMRSAMEDGTLLQPGRPVTILDSLLVNKALKLNGYDEQIWFAETEVSGFRFGVLFATQVLNDYEVALTELGFEDPVVAVESNTTDTLFAGINAQKKTLTVPSCDDYDFQVINLASVDSQNGWALLGEVQDKWVGVSNARFVNIDSDSEGMTVTIRGTPNEEVTISFVDSDSKVHTVSCVVDDANSARVSVPEKTCT